MGCVPDRDTARGHEASVCGSAEVRVEAPTFGAGGGVESDHDVEGGGEVEGVAGEDGGGFKGGVR